MEKQKEKNPIKYTYINTINVFDALHNTRNEGTCFILLTILYKVEERWFSAFNDYGSQEINT